MVREISRRCQKRTFDNKMKTNKAIEYVDKETEKNVTNINQMNFKISLTIFKTRLNQALIFI